MFGQGIEPLQWAMVKSGFESVSGANKSGVVSVKSLSSVWASSVTIIIVLSLVGLSACGV